VDIPVPDLVAMVDWSYLSDVITEEEIVTMLSDNLPHKVPQLSRGHSLFLTCNYKYIELSDECYSTLTVLKRHVWPAFLSDFCRISEHTVPQL